MKNLNLKHHQQAYHHPYGTPINNNTHQQQLQSPYTSAVGTFNSSNKCNNFSETCNYTPTNLANYSGCKSLPKSVSSSNRNNNQSPSLSSTPPTLGGYLANQQQQRLQQLHQNLNQHTPTSPQTSYNMLSLNPTNALNYNFQFNANCGNTSNHNSGSHSFNLSAHTNNRSNNSYNNSNNSINNTTNVNANNHNNRALSRPQRPNSLNISAMASLATPSSYSSYGSTTTQINNDSSCSSACHTAPTAPCNFSTNHFHNNSPRDNFFNFPINQQQQQQLLQNYNNHNYSLQQHQENYNNYQANQHHQQQQQQHQQHQLHQQQQHLQQFQLWQQQLKQQHQNLQFQTNKNCNRNISNHNNNDSDNNNNNNNNNNNCNLTTPVAAVLPTSSASLNGNGTSHCTAAATSTANSVDNSIVQQSGNHCDKLAMDAGEIANFLANELFMQQLVSMECMQTGVPTLTTPTLTPTTLKSIEESFIQLTSEPINAPYQAGFIPPPLGSYNSTPTNTTNNNNSVLTTTTTSVAGISPNAALNNVYVGDTSTGASLPDYGNINDTESENSQGSWTANNLNEENSMATTDTSSAATDTISFQNGLNGLGVNALNNSNSSTNEFTTLAALAVATAAAKISNSGNHNNNTSSSATTTTTTPTRRGGGRRPTTNSNMTPEEEEKRRIRRERNKLAAARCRKRRVDQTNELTEEVQMLEKKREELQKQIESLNGTKQDLEFLLEAHRPTCQRVDSAADILSVNTFESLMPSTTPTANDNITGIDTSLATTARSISPLDLKPVLNDQLLAQIKDEPLDSALDSNSSLDQDGPPSPKRLLLSNNNPMIPPALPNVATLSASLAAASASLNTPIVTAAPVSFGSMYSNNPSLCAPLTKPNSKQRPNSLPTIPRNLAQNLGLSVNENKPPTDINGVAIQTPSTGMFNFDSLMDGGTGLTPVSGPLVPNCSSQNKHPLELVTPTSEPSKLVSL